MIAAIIITLWVILSVINVFIVAYMGSKIQYGLDDDEKGELLAVGIIFAPVFTAFMFIYFIYKVLYNFAEDLFDRG